MKRKSLSESTDNILKSGQAKLSTILLVGWLSSVNMIDTNTHDVDAPISAFLTTFSFCSFFTGLQTLNEMCIKHHPLPFFRILFTKYVCKLSRFSMNITENSIGCDLIQIFASFVSGIKEIRTPRKKQIFGGSTLDETFMKWTAEMFKRIFSVYTGWAEACSPYG